MARPAGRPDGRRRPRRQQNAFATAPPVGEVGAGRVVGAQLWRCASATRIRIPDREPINAFPASELMLARGKEFSCASDAPHVLDSA